MMKRKRKLHPEIKSIRRKIVSEDKILTKANLRVGDLIEYHDWTSGGFLFGIIIDYKDKYYNSKLNIWRPNSIHFLMSTSVDNIKIIRKMDDIEDYKIVDFQNFLNKAKEMKIYYKI